MGSEELPIDPEAEEIEFSMNYRIPKIEGLEKSTKLQVSPTGSLETCRD